MIREKISNTSTDWGAAQDPAAKIALVHQVLNDNAVGLTFDMGDEELVQGVRQRLSANSCPYVNDLNIRVERTKTTITFKVSL